VRIPRVVRFGLPVLLAVATAFVPSRAQEGTPQDAQRPSFRAGVDSVTVDVTVTDKQGKPVTDLTAEDFEIRETGKLQAVQTFKFIKTDDGLDDPMAAREILSESDQQRETARDENRLFVVFLDDYHVRRANSVVVREQVARFLSQLSRHDLVAVAMPLSTVSALTFSRNPDVNAGNVRGFVGRKYDYTPMNAIEARYQDLPPEQLEQIRNNLTIHGLANVCEFLGSLRDGRKSILYVSEGMSASMPMGVRTSGTFVRNPLVARSDSQNFFDTSSLIIDLQTRVFQTATQNNVAIYTLDPRGLVVSEFDIGENVSAADDRRIVQDSTDLLRVIAEQTDGRAIVNRNDPMPALQQMVRDSGAYYLLSYTSTFAPRDGKFHEIQVRVKRRDVDVRARKGYWAYSAEEFAKATAAPKAGPTPEVAGALEGLDEATAPGRGRAVSLWLGADKGPADNGTVTLVWEATAEGVTDPMDTVDHIAVVATAITGEEVFRGSIPRDAQLARPGGVVTFNAPRGEVRVRATAENAKGGRVDTSDAAVTVPDFTSTDPQITTPLLYRGRTARDIQVVRTATSPTPLVAPVFSRTERLLLRFSAYGPAGTTPAVTIRLLNQAGTQLAALPPPVKVRDNLFESEVTLGAFPPGVYLMEIGATSGEQVVKRLVGIRVTG